MLETVTQDRIRPVTMTGVSQLALMLADIDRAVHATARPSPARVAAVLAAHLSDPDLLRGVMCPCDPARYTRHLLGEGDGYCVLAIVWRPGQMSPVHAHKAWCALGVHRGWLVDVSAIHRIANVGVVDSLSIHVYGASFDRLGADVNVVLAA
jgi:predicted metal-dependent enzyme (double-stranded beta helix superfamily)